MSSPFGKRVVVVPLRPGSDGDALHRPVNVSYIECDPATPYLEKLATAWMKARGEARPSETYVLEGLPAGYALFGKPRPGKPSHVDRWLYGHPRHKTFDSPNRFYPHFEWLMDNYGDSIGCPCSVCVKGGVLHNSTSIPSSRSNATSSVTTGSVMSTPPKQNQPTSFTASMLGASAATIAPMARDAHKFYKGRPKLVPTGLDASRVDEEGTPDVFRNLIDKLKRHGSLDEVIEEPISMDWRSEQAMLPEALRKLRDNPQWIPRTGDIVLYVRKIPDGLELLQHEDTGKHHFYDTETETIRGAPVWEAGLVGQAPEEPVELGDAINEGKKRMNVSLSGVRVEPLPNPNNKNKSISKRYIYVPVSHTRPFFLWKHFLQRTPEEDWHPTINNCLTAMSTVSLMGKHRFKGTWPRAQIYCHGIYISSEFLAVGDTVRLLPKFGEDTCMTIMVIKTIRMQLKDLDQASSNDYDEGRPYNSEIWVYGPSYTTDPSRSNKEWVSHANVHTPKSGVGYSKWYLSHPVTKELAVPFQRIIGRLYEHDAMHLWLASADLDQGREDVLEARKFGRENDNRIIESFDISWFWGDSRAAALDLETVNGLEISRYDTERNPKKWREQIKLIDGVDKGKGREDKIAEATGSKSLRSFMAPASATLPVRSQVLRRGDSGSGSTRAQESSVAAGKKRSRVVDLSDEEEDDEKADDVEIRQCMKIIDNDCPTSSQQKKPKVMVYVD